MNYEQHDPYGMYKIQSNGGKAVPTTEHGLGSGLMGADTLIGTDVYNQQSEILGDIKEIILNLQSGRINYAVLSFGGFLGMGEKLFAVPWSALKLDSKNKYFVLNVDKEQLKNAPGFDKDHWPNMSENSWSAGIHSYYGVKPHNDRML
ncbi:MAG: PRC-barrel domain-containing protein [Acidiferrobacterales bacterium]